MKNVCPFLLALLIGGWTFGGESALDTETVIYRIAEQIKQNLKATKQDSRSKKVVRIKFDGSGNVKNREEKSFRPRNVLGVSYQELREVNNRPLTPRERADESRRLAEFIRTLKTRQKTSGVHEDLKAIKWDKMPQRYDITMVRPDDGGYVLSFQPRKEKLPEANRIERVLNRVKGRVWVDDKFNIVKAEGGLIEPVNFGLGFVAKVDQANIQYQQIPRGKFWLPELLKIRWSARIALLSHSRQEIQVYWIDPEDSGMPAARASAD